MVRPSVLTSVSARFPAYGFSVVVDVLLVFYIKMADVSLDELIRKRGQTVGSGMYSRLSNRSNTGNVRSRLQFPVSNRPVASSFQRSFDARQKIGVKDARMRLGVKDAREKLAAKDARFRIAGKVQDAREMLNSRKQQVSGRDKPAKMMDAREKLSLKRSAPSVVVSPALASGSSTINLTKTIQIPQQKTINSNISQSMKGMRINVVNNQPAKPERSSQMEDDDDEEEMSLSTVPAKQMKLTAMHTLQKQLGRPGGQFTLNQAVPITKVVQNDTYTAPVVPQAAALTAPPLRSKALSNMSRTLVTKKDTSSPQSVPPEPVLYSPLEGTKMTVNNLHPRVTEEDIVASL
ncbi:hypothetical protein GDO86_007510 [Hymenochirus boettgeri]|uniref:Polymerase delta-interacting protein 3 n=1 Tax=Hymenochirus boettgeri TaxID=247094 RepID=A0A8T2IWV1_9PIPI|nr:hypothetical protein GDO86_007510 [Hymenochirus boettgeri]